MKNRELKLSIFYDHIITGAEQRGISKIKAAEMVKDMGINFVDINSKFLIGSDQDSIEYLNNSGLKIGCICHECNLSSESNYNSEIAIIDMASELDVKEILILLGLLQEDSKEEQIDNMIQGINEICKYAQTKNVTLGIETYDNAGSPLSGNGVVSFLNRCEALKCVFDTGNFAFWDEDEIEYAKILSDKVMHVHLKDRALVQHNSEQAVCSVKGRKLYPSSVGDGIIKIREIIEILKSIGFDGFYSIEHYGAEDMFDYMQKSVDWIYKFNY